MSADRPGVGFVSLVRDFAEFMGLEPPHADDALGLEIKSGDYTARILPDPVDVTRFLIELDVCPAGDAAPIAHHLLHRINYAGRFVHSWTAGIDGDDSVVIYCRRNLATTDVGALEALVSDGLDRAAALHTMWTLAANAGDTDVDRAVLRPGLLLG